MRSYAERQPSSHHVASLSVLSLLAPSAPVFEQHTAAVLYTAHSHRQYAIILREKRKEKKKRENLNTFFEVLQITIHSLNSNTLHFTFCLIRGSLVVSRAEIAPAAQKSFCLLLMRLIKRSEGR